mmetsp:Transcript_16362/g.25299  ORF Transcript_16362/g.25299 Transcript_16362/m.25299 type:complete len:131 (-) Transcript_16362:490-882(-)
MVYHNVVLQHTPLGGYGNETFRARHGYKDEHMHDPPQRRNRDFKPVPYGTYRGIPNYRHSEPYCILKNLKDMSREDHNIGIASGKSFLKGGLLGAIASYLYVAGGPQTSFEMNKLTTLWGPKKFTGGSWR